jgi:formate hydrogenlyase subunit 6/NADH:ubiquinone oxidoreductase subunit I
MKLGALFSDIIRALVKRPATQSYPFERAPTPAQLRGAVCWDPERCTGCAMCVRDCPANALELITIDKAKKRFVLRYQVDRCTFCAQCVRTCNFGCLKLSSEQWELAALSRAGFARAYGGEADAATLGQRPQAEDPVPAGA